MNKEWHKQHTMPAKATEKKRIEWHLEHIRNCACRPFPVGLLAKLDEAGKRKLAKAQAEKTGPAHAAID